MFVEEFDGEEYTTTNRGEVYGVMNTISEIVRTFIQEHPKIQIYEFNAVEKEDEVENKNTNARMLLYKRYLPKIFDGKWEFKIEDNHALVKRSY